LWFHIYNTLMGSHSDVLIIGGGVIGLTTAYYLAREGVRVRLLDRAAPGSEASWAGAGIIPPGNPAGAKAAYDRLRAISSRAFPALAAELRERTGIDNGYRICGGIEVFEIVGHDAPRLWLEEGIEFQELSPSSVRELEPNARLTGPAAYLLPGMAQVRNPWHLRALVAACQQIGVAIESGREVAEFRTAGDRIEGATTEDGTGHAADRFLIAAGAWSQASLSKLGVQAGLHPVKGQIVLFRPPRAVIRRVIGFNKRYLVPRDDGRILVGSTEEPEAGFDKRPTRHGSGELIRFAMEVVPELANVDIEASWAGLRPGTPDGLPFLGPIPGWRNAFVATGHYRAGIQLSPGTAQIMTDLLVGRPPTLSIADFRLDRPKGPPAAVAFRS
jgi:glycine oxidase